MKMKTNGASGLLATVKAALPSLLANHGVDVQLSPPRPGSAEAGAPDLLAQIIVDGRQSSAALYVRSRVGNSVLSLAQEHALGTDVPVVIVVPRLRPVVKERLRALNLNFADLTGTIYLTAPGIRIDVEGRETPPETVRGHSSQLINPFSKKASAILRTLSESFGQPLTPAELAQRTSLSSGWISGVGNELIARGYVTGSESGLVISNPVAMIRDWVREYRWTQNKAQIYVTPFAYDEVAPRLKYVFSQHRIQWALTLIAAAQQRIGYVSSDAVTHIYAQADNDNDLQEALVAMYAEPVRDGGNLTVFTPPYYGRAVFIGAKHDTEAKPVVSDLQLLLDLAHYPVRGPELAEELVRARIFKQFDLSNSDISDLVKAIS